MKNLTIIKLGSDVRPATNAQIEAFKAQLNNVKDNAENIIVVDTDVMIQYVEVSSAELVVQ